jgi:flavin-dependent dehydrogenase
MTFELIVVGGGMAGLPLASKAANKGLRTALLARAEIIRIAGGQQ